MSLRCILNCLFVTTLFCIHAQADWRPINPADLTLKQSRVDPNADAEALFREVHVSNEQHGNSYPKSLVSEYVRLKIFTERGKELGNVQLPFYGKEFIADVQGRTIQPDGSIVLLEKDSIFQKVLEKRGSKTKVVTFAMPAVEPGSIIEYRYTRNEGERINRYQPLEVQTDYAVAEVTLFIKPISNAYAVYPAMRYLPFGCVPEPGEPTRDGFNVLRVRNVPAFHDEPFSPPRLNAHQWILVYYEDNSKTGKDKYWTSLGKSLESEYSQQIKVNGELKALAAEVVSGATTDDEKLDRLLNYCRTKLKDTSRDEVTVSDRDELKINKNSIDTIRRKQGTSVDINYAFVALAQAAGFEARRVDLSDRSTFLFFPGMQSRFFLNAFDIAVSVGDKWRFYDVTNPALPAGQLRWQEQGVYALVADSKQPEMIVTPMLTAAQSMVKRMATLAISEDGILEGDVRELWFGNFASGWRERNRYTNAEQREEQLRGELKQRFADFAVSKVSFAASEDAAKPVGVVYHIVVRNYAQRTGKRLFVHPDYFAAGLGTRFTESTRYNHIYFDFPWSESDTISIKVPVGFELDHADAPGGVNVPATCTYTVKMRIDKEHNVLSYDRHLVFGDKDMLMFDKKNYSMLKKIFDTIHESDDHMLTLKTTETAAVSSK